MAQIKCVGVIRILYSLQVMMCIFTSIHTNLFEVIMNLFEFIQITHNICLNLFVTFVTNSMQSKLFKPNLKKSQIYAKGCLPDKDRVSNYQNVISGMNVKMSFQE